MSSKDLRCAAADDKEPSPNLSGIRLFKTMVRRVRQKITESKLTKSTSTGDMPTIITKLEEISIVGSDASPQKNARPRSPPAKESLRRIFGSSRASSEDKLRNSGYSSDSATEKHTSRNTDFRIRIRQNVRSRSKSYSKSSVEKKPQRNILRQPPRYVHLRGISGLHSHRVPVY